MKTCASVVCLLIGLCGGARAGELVLASVSWAGGLDTSLRSEALAQPVPAVNPIKVVTAAADEPVLASVLPAFVAPPPGSASAEAAPSSAQPASLAQFETVSVDPIAPEPAPAATPRTGLASAEPALASAPLAAAPALAAASPAPPTKPGAPAKPAVTVMASFYDTGRVTANGEPFAPMGLTAAHRSLPFGTMLRVTNKRTGQSIVVRVNDRGPYIAGRTLDLSRGAARAIGMEQAGVGAITMQVVSDLR